MQQFEAGEVPMKNDTFTEKISLWLDNELNPNEVAELEAHLVDCPACRQTYKAMQHVHQVLHSAARRMAAPNPGFTQRFEAQLAHHRPARLWQVWLTIGMLFLGALFISGLWVISEGITLVGLSSYVFDAGLLNQWLAALIESAADLRLALNLGALLLRVSYLMMSQPVFWGGVISAVSLIGFWVWVMWALSRRSLSSIQMLI